MSLDYIPEPVVGASSGPAAPLEVRVGIHKTFHEVEDTGEADVLDSTQEGKQVTQF